MFDLGDLFGQFFNQAQQGQPRRRSAKDPADFEEAFRQQARSKVEEAEPTKIQASDGSWLEVKGADVYADIRIPFDQAILGTVATVPTLDGKAEVKIPPGTASGKKLRLRGKGVPDRAGALGNHYVTIQIDVPGDLDGDEKKLLVQLVQRLRKRGQND